MSLAEALVKLQNEMATNLELKVIGDFLTQHVTDHPEDADKIMAEKKTIAASVNEMRKVAKKKAVNNFAILTDEEGFSIVLQYYGIEKRSDKTITPQTQTQNVTFDVKLEDFL